MDVFSRVYAETTVKVAVINVPWALRWPVGWVLDVCPSRLRARVHVLGSEYEAALEEDIDAEAMRLLRSYDATLASHRGRRLPSAAGPSASAAEEPPAAAAAAAEPNASDATASGAAAPQGTPPCAECLASGTEPPSTWADVSGSWVVHHAEGDVDGVLALVGYGPWARSAFRLGNYGAGVARIDITMRGPRDIKLIFGGGPMPATTNELRIDGTTPCARNRAPCHH